MKILFSSYAFSPQTGGIESSSDLLAREFVRLGHEVRLITQTPGPDACDWPFPVIRRPGGWQLWGLVRWCDVFFHNNVTLQAMWPLFLSRRPWVVAHQTWLARVGGGVGWRDKLKSRLLRSASNVSISRAIAEKLEFPSVIIGNPFNEALFRQVNPAEARSGVVFLGRLVSDKGGDILIRALSLLSGEGVCPRLTIIGSGPEEHNLRRLVRELGLGGQVDFVGAKKGAALVEILNRQQVMAVPSRWAEPFGIVALEGIACGCVVVGSEQGGLPEAMGACGVTFPNGDAEALAGALRALLADEQQRAALLAAAPGHLAAHAAAAVATAYLAVFEQATPWSFFRTPRTIPT